MAAVGIILAVLNTLLLVWLIVERRRDTQAPLQSAIREEFRLSREEAGRESRLLREEVRQAQRESSDAVIRAIGEIATLQQNNLEGVQKRLQELTYASEQRLEHVRKTVEERLLQLQQANEAKLDQMRHTVDEKLQSTLEKRLGESFKLVSDRLEAVQRGLGEMQSLATGVGDLKRVLTNVKSRGTWGEVQLGAILEQVLTTDQFDRNVKTRPGSDQLVEYAIRLPGTDPDGRSVLWLPIDSKFPQENYQRLEEAAEAGDVKAVEQARKELAKSIELSARDIRDRYVEPPHTTDFAILFLPTEGLYAEVLRTPGMVENLQQKFRIVVAGPTTLTAILNSLRMGFRTLAIEKRSSEVWQILAAVKSEFGKFGDVLTKVQKKLDEASKTIDQTEIRTRAMNKALRHVEDLPEGSAPVLFSLADDGADGEADDS